MAHCIEGGRLVALTKDPLFADDQDCDDVEAYLQQLGFTRVGAAEGVGNVCSTNLSKKQPVTLDGFGPVAFLLDIEIGGLIETILCRDFGEYLQAMKLSQGHFAAAPLLFADIDAVHDHEHDHDDHGCGEGCGCSH
ncbi:hypothetical protein [Microvirgula aerodenitrificans]|uniref:hypothetical protein n=1 Tax=Microvirgula aerodenitrificans TaxID=57480 RepID=UPI00248ECEB7|nr:hypothetical protein [Microvirgula aerodenitrificans]